MWHGITDAIVALSTLQFCRKFARSLSYLSCWISVQLPGVVMRGCPPLVASVKLGNLVPWQTVPNWHAGVRLGNLVPMQIVPNWD